MVNGSGFSTYYLKSIWKKKRGRKSAKDKVIQLNPHKEDTRKKIAKQLRISTGNLSKLEMIDRISPELIDEIDNGNADITINQAHESISNSKKKNQVALWEEPGVKKSIVPNMVKFNIKDEYYTPRILVEPIIKYLTPGSTIWCPFDPKDSEFVLVLQENGFNVIHSHIWTGQDFFHFQPDVEYDYIISNPPFSRKLEVLERLYKLNKPFAMIMGLPVLNHQEIGNFYVGKDSQLLIFNKKISYDGNTSAFNSSYFCRGILDNDLTYEHLPHNNTGKNFVPSRMIASPNTQISQAA